MSVSRSAALALATLGAIALLTHPASAYRSPVTLSVLDGGVGLPTLPNDVWTFSPDGAHVFGSGATSPGGWPDGLNLMPVPALMLGLPDGDELDALSYGDDLVLPPVDVQQGSPIEFYFAVDSAAVGIPGTWPPEVLTEAPQAAGDVFFAWPPVWPYGGNHLGVPEAILGLNPPRPDDLDALIFSQPVFSPPRFPLYFSVDRASCGLPGTAVRVQCNSPAPPAQAADVFVTWGTGTNQLFANEATMGLDWNDDNIDAMALWDSGPLGVPNGQLDPGLDWIYFSVDWLTNGLQGTAVNLEALSGNIQGDIFFSDFTGWNWKVLDGTQLGLLEPSPALPFTPDEDNLNALETEWWMDLDGDQIPDLVDNCPGVPNPMQLDALGNGIGDVCDPTGAELVPGERLRSDVLDVRSVEPNPFTDQTLIHFTLPTAGAVAMDIYSVDGRRVRSLFREHRGAGSQFALWNGRDDAGRRVSGGVYWVKVTAGQETAIAKMVRVD